MSSVPTTLIAQMIEQLDASVGQSAKLEELLRSRMQEIRTAAEGDPFANATLLASLEISRGIDQGKFTLQDIKALVHRLSIRCLLDRAAQQRAYLGEPTTATSEHMIREAVSKIADHGAVAFEDFQRQVESPVFGIVLTAHPTFGTTQEVARLLAMLAADSTDSGEALDDEAKDAVVRLVNEASYMPPLNLTLTLEHEWSLDVLAQLQAALDRTTEIVLEVARIAYPDEWTTLQPCLVSVASWVGYDLDGRTDIVWTDTIAKRLLVKQGQIGRCREAVGKLAAQDSAITDQMSDIANDLDGAKAAVEQQLAAFDHVSDVGALARACMSSRDAAMISTAALRAKLDTAIAATADPAIEIALLALRASAKWQGLSLAHTHVRLNATQLHNAIRRQVGMASPPTDPAHRRRYVTSINDLLSRVTPETINFAALSVEQATAKRLFMIVQQIVRYVDADTPVRFLIAETEAAFTLLTALYFARLFDVEERVEISPLFETGDAIEHGDAILEEALRSEFYRDYVQRTGRLCVQFGFSDSGRYLGQMAATFQLERLRLRIAAVMERQGLTGVQLILFNTHGESIGRGGHPAGLGDRFRYLAPPVTRARFAEAGIKLKEEVSFQGGDGFALLMTRPAVLSVIGTALETFIGVDSEASEDPIYEAGDYAVEFFSSVRLAFAALASDPNYLVLLSAFGTNLAPTSGSRPTQRQQDGLATAQRYTEIAQLRAIPNNTILQQLGLLANTVHGVGVARAQDPELFEQMYELSPRFRRAIVMAKGAIAASDLEVLKAYIDMLDPGTWLTRSARVRSRARAAELRTVSKHLERLDLSPSLSKLYRRLQRDFQLLTDEDSGLDSSGMAEAAGPRHETLVLLHVLRLAMLQRLFVLAMQIPDFSPQRGVSREELIARVLRLETASAIAQLRMIFPRSVSPSPSPDADAEPASYRGDVMQGYAREHDMIFDPMLDFARMIVEIGNLISTEIGAVG